MNCGNKNRRKKKGLDKENILPKILLWDLETSHNLVLSFGLYKQNIPAENVITHRHIYCASYRWYGESKTHTTSILDDYKRFKRNNHDDYHVVKEMHKILSGADAHVAHYGCPTPDQKILTSGLRWVNAGSLKVGDKLAGFNANVVGSGYRRKYENSIVTHVGESKQPVVRIFFHDRVITCSAGHPLLMSSNKKVHNNLKWKQAGELQAGDKVSRVLDVWSTDSSFGAGYLAVFFDGEGHLSIKNTLHGKTIRVGMAQKNNEALKMTLQQLKLRGFNPSKMTDKSVHRIYLRGGKDEELRFLGTIRPERLMPKLDIADIGAIQTKKWETIKKVQILGMQDIVELSTSTQTYIMEGFPSHNSKFDLPVLTSRMIAHDLPPLPKIISLDTKKIASKHFNFASNKLNFIAKYLGHKGKITNPSDLWLKCWEGDEKALKRMAVYNRGDIDALYFVFEKLMPYVKNNPLNAGLFRDGLCCPNPVCGSPNLRKNGFAYTRVRKYQRYQCKDCGSWCDERRAYKDGTHTEVK